MKTKHTVTDSKGQVHKRTSASRLYTHAVVVHLPAIPAHDHFLAWPARTHVEWASSLTLAQKAASPWRRKDTEGVEIIEAVRS
jgi:hypothetical protein